MTTTEAPSDALLGFLFRSCVACYNAKPWQLLNDSDTVRLNVDAEPPILARFTGPDGDSSPGVLLVSAYTKEQELEAPEEPIAFSGARVFMVFVPEHEAPQWLRDARRVNKWPLASPSAFPAVFAATNDAGETRALSADEMRTLCVAINVLVTFVATKRKQIESRQPHGDVIKVRDDAGLVRVALVQFPFYADALDGWQSHKTHYTADSHANLALQDVRNAALDLPDASTILDRLVWSFFRDTGPNYASEEEGWSEAMARFLTWAIFGYRADGKSLADRALQQLGETKSSEELEMHRRIVTPRVGMFRVSSVKRDVGLQLHDVLRGDTLDVVERLATRKLHEGNGVLGTLHPISDTQWIMAPGAALYPSLPRTSQEKEEMPAESFAPTVEASVFGAGTDWIQMADADHLQDAYEMFAEVLTENGDTLPMYHQLQEQIDHAAQPTEIIQSLDRRATWWSDTELNVVLAFVMRIWNVTPRAELGGKSPDEMHASRGRLRATPPNSRGRKR